MVLGAPEAMSEQTMHNLCRADKYLTRNETYFRPFLI